MQPERHAVEGALHRMKDAAAVAMEFFGSRPDRPKHVCLEEVASSDVYAGIFGCRYGYIDGETGLSMTELEYRTAAKRQIPCLIYLKQPGPSSPLLETDPRANEQLDRLKSDLRRAHVVTFFDNADNLATRVAIDLHNLFVECRLPEPEEQRKQITPRELHIVLITRLSADEVRTLCFYLRVPWEHLAGDALPAKARAVIEYVMNREHFDDLVNELRALRPDIKW